MPFESFNDDDWIVYDKRTMQIVKIRGSKEIRPQAGPGQYCVSGMSAKFLGLRRLPQQSSSPAFLRMLA